MGVLNIIGPMTGEWTNSDKGERSTTMFWFVQTLLTDTEIVASSAVTFPRGTANPYDPGLVAKSIKATRHPDASSLGWFKVEVLFDNKPWAEHSDPNNDPTDQGQDQTPTARPLTVNYGSVPITKVLTVDKEGTSVVNSVGEPFTSPPVEYTDRHCLITLGCYKDVSIDPITQKLMYEGTINSGPFSFDNYATSWPAYTLRVNEYTWDSEYDGKSQTYCYKVKLVLETNLQDTYKWRYIQVANLGTRELYYDSTTASLKYRQIYVGGQPITKPVPISITADGSGQFLMLAPGAPIQFLKFAPYTAVDFGTIGQAGAIL